MTSNKPIVLRLGEDIKYNQDFYNDVFVNRFHVVANEEPDRASFIKALKEQKCRIVFRLFGSKHSQPS